MDVQDDLGLRRLFRPPIDHLPVSEQLKYYHQRDFVPSHLYRMGAKLFGKETAVRKRIIEASILTTTAKTHQHCNQKPHQADGRPLNTPLNSFFNQSKVKSPQKLSDEDYQKWVSDRKALRENLEHFGDCKRWLMSKQCTPLESSVLKGLKSQDREEPSTMNSSTTIESISSESDELTPQELDKIRRKEKRQLVKDLKKLEEFICKSRLRLSGYLVQLDEDRTCVLQRETVVMILDRMRVPVEEFVVDILCDALEKEGKIDYRLLFKGGFANAVEKYLEELEKHGDNGSTKKKASHTVQEEVVSGDALSFRDGIEEYGIRPTISTMEGRNGEWSQALKQESLKQFADLIEFCHKHQISLDQSLVERGLLLPTDKTRKQCLSQLRQAGVDLPSRKIVESPLKKGREEEDGDSKGFYGWQYKQIRGSKGSRTTRLSTGVAKVKAKTDCWLTYKQFQKLTEEIQARPGFNYKYHGLPPNNAFWPGALLDKLRLHLPKESLKTRPYSLYNIFQPVTHPMIFNPSGPLDTTKGVIWPENSSGHVQLGPSLSRSKKSYIL